MAGADLIRLGNRPLAVALGGRVHGVRRPDYERVVPGRDPFVLLFSAGVQWRGAR